MLLELPAKRRRMQCDRCKAVGYVTYEDRGDYGCFYCGNQMYDVHAKEGHPAMTTTTPTGETTRRLVSGRADPDEAYRVPNINAEFEYAPDLQEIANALILKKFPDFPECAITYVWKGRGGSTNGAMTLGKTVKASGLTGFFSKVDYVIWVAADHVYDEKMTRYQVEALLFHELCHVGFEEDEDKVTLTMNPHDFEGFRREIEEYGFWKPDVAAIAVTVQGRLELDDPREARARLRRQTEVEPLAGETAGGIVIVEAVEEAEPEDLPANPSGITSVTLSAGGESVTLTPEAFARLADAVEAS